MRPADVRFDRCPSWVQYWPPSLQRLVHAHTSQPTTTVRACALRRRLRYGCLSIQTRTNILWLMISRGQTYTVNYYGQVSTYATNYYEWEMSQAKPIGRWKNILSQDHKIIQPWSNLLSSPSKKDCRSMSLEARSRLTCCDWSLLTDCPRGNICKPLISFRCECGQICKSFFKFWKWLMLEQVWYISKFVKDPCWPQASMWQHLQIPDFFRCESKNVNVAILKLC